jgi:hypothetical protein
MITLISTPVSLPPSPVHPNLSTFQHANVQTFPRSNLPWSLIFPVAPSNREDVSPSSTVYGQSSVPNLQPSIFNLQSLAFVPQTTNVEIPVITNNSPRRLALKSQESYLFLEKPILNLFLLKNQQSFHSSIADSCA